MGGAAGNTHAHIVRELGMEIETFVVDSFSDKPFAGNPAAVCLVRRDIADRVDEVVMKKIAAEMNHSETAFVVERSESTFETGTEFDLRWFTPTVEVDLCGHATLATSSVLFHKLRNPNQEIEFFTKSGVLKALRNGEEITLNFPLNPCQPLDSTEGLKPLITTTIGDTPLHDIQYSPSTKKLLLRFPDTFTRGKLESLPINPQAMKLAQQGGPQVKGVILTVKGSEEFDFLSRYFAPWVGIPEDSVTGAAHTVLASYWSQQLDKKEILARQCSPRGGNIRIEICEDERVRLSGKAYIVLDGKLKI